MTVLLYDVMQQLLLCYDPWTTFNLLIYGWPTRWWPAWFRISM